MGLPECLARIDERDEEIHAWSFIDRTAEGGEGALSGVVLGVKDVIDVVGMPTTYGSPIFATNIAAEDASAVSFLRAAGAIVLGKTVTAEFATYHPGPTVNPRKLGHTPGGSSSGSAAATADGQADIALGTQTAGSMIRPGSFCGTLAFKPTFGRYPLDGVLETAPSLDTLGLFSRNLQLLITADSELSGQHDMPERQKPLRVGVCKMTGWNMASTEMREALTDFVKLLSDADCALTEIVLPSAFGLLEDAQALIHRYEASQSLGQIRHQYSADVSDAFRAMIDAGEATSEADYRTAKIVQVECQKLMTEVFFDIDLLLAPGALGAAPEGINATGDPIFQRIWTAVGAPCLGFPVTWRSDGLPLGLQVIGLPGTDRQLLSNAGLFVELVAFREV